MNRHNAGFLALDAYVASIGQPKWREEKKALVTRFKVEDEEVLLVKPQTYMNLSGEPTRALLDYYKIPIAQMIIIHDDIDQGFGAVRIHKNRGAGGHNGLKSLNEQLGTQDYVRIKMGVGRPAHPQMQVADYVLQDFSKAELIDLHDFLRVTGDAFESLIFDGYDKAATKHTRAALGLAPQKE
jgi:PTH1 family peptidyl-tRNA hydrolase